MVDGLVFSCVSFSYDEDNFKVKCTGNVIFKLYKLYMAQQICITVSFFFLQSFFFVKVLTKLWLWISLLMVIHRVIWIEFLTFILFYIHSFFILAFSLV